MLMVYDLENKLELKSPHIGVSHQRLTECDSIAYLQQVHVATVRQLDVCNTNIFRTAECQCT